MERNTPKHEYWVKWSGLDAFVVKNSKVVSATQTGALIAHVEPVLHNCIVMVMKLCETHPNMSFGSNGVDWMPSLQKKTQQWLWQHKPAH